MRVGVKGETQINDQLTGYGQWEYNVQANNTESSSDQAWTRLAFAGLKFGDAGSFDYGRNYGVVYDVTSSTDVLPEFGGDTYGSDNFLQSRANGVATYRNSDFFGLVDGLNFALQYQGKNGSVSGEGATNNGRGWSKQNGDGFGTSLTYDIWDGISAGFAYSHSKRTDEQNSVPALGRGDNAETYTGGLKYDANNIYWPLSTPRPTTQLAPVPRALLTKRRTSKWLLSTSSTSVCVRPWLTCSLKVKTCRITSQV